MPDERRRRKLPNGRVSGSCHSAQAARCAACSSGAPRCGVPSASGRSKTRRIGFRDEDGHHLGSAHHLALLNHPVVYEKLVTWLGAAPRASVAA